MELQFLTYNFMAFFVFMSSLLIIISRWKKSRRFNPKHKLPPGPWKLPIIGSIHHLMGGSLPHHVLRDLAKKHGPLIHLKLGEVPVVVVSSPRFAKEIFKTHDLAFASRPDILAFKLVSYNYSNIGFCPYGECWRQMRKIAVLQLLSSKRVQSFGPIRLDEGFHLIASVKAVAGKEMNLSHKISSYTSSMVCRAAFGKVRRDQDTVVKLVKKLFSLAGGLGLAELFPSSRIIQLLFGSKSKLLKIHRTFDGIMNDIIDEHIKNLEATGKGNGEFGEEDLVDVLLKIKETGDLQFQISTDNIKGLLFDIFAGAIETSSSVVDWAMSELMRNPHVMAKAQTELREALKGKKSIDETDIQGLGYLKLVIKETLRLHPPAALLIPRESREDCQIDGYHIPRKTRVITNAWAIGRDEDYWANPDTFIPERFENNPIDFSGNHYELVPFGAGRRVCPGMSFAIANVELPLALLLYYFNWKLPAGLEPTDLDMSEASGLSNSRKSHLHLIPSLFDSSLDMSC